MIEFAYPLFLLLLPLVALMGYRRLKAPGGVALRFSHVHRLQAASRAHRSRWMGALPLLRLISLILLVVAIARPRSGSQITEIKSEGIDIVIALDTSGSMQAIDVTPGDQGQKDRLRAAVEVAATFVEGRQADRIGLVVFGESAYTQCPLTLDYGVLTAFLAQAEVGMAGDGTAIGSAIGVSTNRLKGLESTSQIVILITDGRNTAGRIPPMEAAKAAAALGVKVYTIGVGSNNAYIPVDTILGRQLVPQPVDLDEDTLKAIAEETEGRYFRAANQQALIKTLALIDELERTEVLVEEHMEYTELYPFLLWPALLLLLLEVTLANTRLRRLP